MGANTSTPRTASMHNPTGQPNVILVSDEVAKRIDGTRREIYSTHNTTEQAVTNAEPYVCKKCSAEKNVEKISNDKLPQKPKVLLQTPYERKRNQIETDEFESTLNKLDKTIGKPIDWTSEHKVELKALQTDLLKCYKDHPREPLRCYNNAKDYQDFVFEKQYKTILKHTLGAGDGAEK